MSDISNEVLRVWCHTCGREGEARTNADTRELNCLTCNGEFVEELGQNVESFISPHIQHSQPGSLNSLGTDDLIQGIVNQVLGIGQSQAGISPVVSGLQSAAGVGRSLGVVLRQSGPLGFGPAGQPFQIGSGQGGATGSFEDLLHHLMMNEPSHGGSPPASTEAIDKLERRTENTSELGECSISQEPFTDSDIAVILPCGHAYQESLIVQWLQSHNTCPVCRVSIS